MRIGLAVGVVVHRIDAPLVAGAVMLGVQDAVHHRIAHVQVGRGHVDLGAQDARAVGEFARPHALEQIEIFFDRAIAIRAVLAGLGQRAAVFADFVGGQVVYVGLARFDQLAPPIRRAGRNSRRRNADASHSKPSQLTSSMMESTYSVSSFSGLVSSKRRLVLPPNSSARPKSRQMALAWPMCR